MARRSCCGPPSRRSRSTSTCCIRRARAYLTAILDTDGRQWRPHGAARRRGLRAKEAGTSCFMIPRPSPSSPSSRGAPAKRGIEVLIEVHSLLQEAGRDRAPRWTGSTTSRCRRCCCTRCSPARRARAHWTEMRPNNAVTVLDTHDGIGVIDIGADQLDRSLKGLVPTRTSTTGQAHPRQQPRRAGRPPAPPRPTSTSTRSTAPTTTRSAATTAYLAARAVQFFLPGVPQVYYVGALAGENDMELLRRTRRGPRHQPPLLLAAPRSMPRCSGRWCSSCWS
jgi:sucrose phosphorylase